MNKYAIIKIGPFQYTVEEGVEYSVPKFEAEASKKLKVEEVLAVFDGTKLNLGKPNLTGAIVELDIIEQAKGEKVQTQVYKAKSRYRKTTGLRKRVTKFKVNKISLK